MLRFMMVLLGLGLLVVGGAELMLTLKSREHATVYSLADLEQGAPVTNLNGTIGPHWALFDEQLFRYETRRNEEPKDEDRVTEYFYPVISSPPAGDSNASFRVVVRDHKARKVKDLPRGTVPQPEVSGLFTYGVNGEGREMLQTRFPQVDFDQVILFEIGRKRTDAWEIAGCFGIGTALLAAAAIFRKKEKFKVTKVVNPVVR